MRCRRDGQFGMLEVEDSGLGIASAERELMFGRFARLDDKTHGSGLGLAIVRDVAAAHGARSPSTSWVVVRYFRSASL